MDLSIGKVIRRLRSEHSVTQEELAEYLGISYQAVSKWETGTTMPDITLLPKLAAFFGVTTDYLLGVCDDARMGALRFAVQPDGPFLAADDSTAVPAWNALRELEAVSLAFEREEDALNDRWLRLLLAPGSCLGHHGNKRGRPA